MTPIKWERKGREDHEIGRLSLILGEQKEKNEIIRKAWDAVTAGFCLIFYRT
jgi:hypothetical protein